MSEDRTQPPSKRRRQIAREHGQAAHSPELTAAAGWLAAVVVLGFVGDDLALGLTDLVRGSLRAPARLPDESGAVASHVRGLVMGLAWPLAAILGGFAGGALAAHQFQVRGLWATSQIVPDLKRLWRFSNGPGLSTLVVQSIWSMAKAVIVVAASAWALRAGWSDFLRQSSLEGPGWPRPPGRSCCAFRGLWPGRLLALGLVDYVSAVPAVRGDAANDARGAAGRPARDGRRPGRARRSGSASPDRCAATLPSCLPGPRLLLCGAGGLTLVIAGGPPPRRVSFARSRKEARACACGDRPRRAVFPRSKTPGLAAAPARRPAAGSAIAAELIADLAAIWPALAGDAA